MQTIAETCVRFDAAHLSINFVSEITVTHVSYLNCACLPTVGIVCLDAWWLHMVRSFVCV